MLGTASGTAVLFLEGMVFSVPGLNPVGRRQTGDDALVEALPGLFG